ncbi:MAG: ABC transporter permease [Hyphomicrobiales bacterium]|nr:ABC transporter permease [Rickettsiales bacterium]MCP5362092.1 ABC transporter permease [Hyphomicrobiales bacterium]
MHTLATPLRKGQFNWLGFWTLYRKEVWRFMKVYNQTLLAPMVTSLLFLAIFSLAVGRRVETVQTVPFSEFIAAGLIMMTIVQNAFANSSSSLIMGKVLGTVIDFIMPPISAGEMTLAMALGGVTRGFLVGIIVTLSIAIFVPLSVHSLPLAFLFILLASLMMALLGLVAGIFSESFDQMAAITSYVITPLAFLSGTFYSVQHLPAFWQMINHGNPFFYMIDGFRYAMTGYSDTSVMLGIAVLTGTNIVLYLTAWLLLRSGYRIKT